MYIDYVDVAGRSIDSGLRSDYSGQKMAIFNLYTRKYLAKGYY